MINVSNEFKEVMKERAEFKPYAEITFRDGRKVSLDSRQFLSGNNSIVDGAGISSFPIGVAIQKNIQIEVLNDTGQYADFDFFGAKIRMCIELQLSASKERIEKGTYTVITPETYGETIIITAYDDMYKADKDYNTTLEFPCSAGVALRDICSTCDIVLGSTTFLHDDFMIQEKPTGTFRQVIGYIAMISGGNARIDVRNKLQIIPYDFGSFEKENGYHTLSSWMSPKIDYNDSAITGLKTVIKGDIPENDVEISVGTDTYSVIVENPLIGGQEEMVLTWLLERIGNVAFRPFSGDLVSNPLVEFMDLAKVVDRKGNSYNTFVTDVNFLLPGYTTVKNASPGMERNAVSYPRETSKVEKAVRKLVEKERSDRELAIKSLNKALKESSGMYSTEEKQEDGSIIYYLHDKPSIAESKNVMKLTAEAIGFSLDGGRTYPFGFTIDGELVMRIIQTEGLNAGWINTGRLVAKDKSGNTMFLVDIDTGEVKINAQSISMGSSKVATEEEVNSAVKDVKIEYALSDSTTTAPASGWSTEAPEWVAGKYMWQKTTTTLVSGEVLPSTMTCIQGAKGDTGATGATGPKGDTGEKGAKGDTGATGPKGDTGATGPKGDIGATGPKGDKGDKGDKGNTGATGPQGPKGDTGVGITGITEHYAVSSSNSIAPTTWSATVPSMTATNKYLWNYETITYTNGTTSDTKKRVIGVYGDKGATGGTGAAGKGIKSITNYYLATASASGVTDSTSGWTTAVQTVTASKKYLWNYELITYTDNTTSKTSPCIIGAYGDTGAKGDKGDKGDKGATGATGPQGPKGDTGVGIKAVTNYYLATASASGVTVSTSGWTTNVQNVSASKKYLWNYELITYTDNSTLKTTPCIIGAYGDKGATGAKGDKGDTGATGNGISSIVEYYAVSASNSTAPTSWTTSIPTLTATNKYLWNYETITYTNGSTKNTDKRVIGVYGDKGDKGATGATGPQGPKGDTGATGPQGPKGNTGATGPQGPKGDTGAAGKGIKSTAITYQAGASGTTAPTGTWSATIPSVAKGQYLWSRTILTYTDNTTSTPAYSVAYIPQNGATGAKGDKGDTGAKGDKGDKGDTGATGTGVSSITQQYYLSTSKTTQSGGSWVESMPTWSSGKYLWTRYKIIYTNPSSTKYTSPICDSSWEAVNALTRTVFSVSTPTDTSVLWIDTSTTPAVAKRYNPDTVAWEVVNDTTEILNSIREDVNSVINQLPDQIDMSVKSQTYLKGEVDTLVSELRSVLTQTDDELAFTLSELRGSIEDVDGKIDTSLENYETYFKFRSTGMYIGKNDSKIKLRLSNDRLSFTENDVEVAYISDRKMYITELEVTGNILWDGWGWTHESNGSRSFGKIR